MASATPDTGVTFPAAEQCLLAGTRLLLVPLRVGGRVGLSGWLHNQDGYTRERSPISVLTGIDVE